MLHEYRGDGLRFDMAHSLTWECTQHIIAGLRENPYWRDKYLIAEWTSEQQDRWDTVIRELGFNAVWGLSDPFAFRRAVNGENTISDTLQFIHEDRTNTVLAFKRWHEGGNIVVVVVNLSDRQWQEYDYGIDLGGETGRWSEIFNSQSSQYDGWNDSGNYQLI